MNQFCFKVKTSTLMWVVALVATFFGGLVGGFRLGRQFEASMHGSFKIRTNPFIARSSTFGALGAPGHNVAGVETVMTIRAVRPQRARRRLNSTAAMAWRIAIDS